MPYGVTDAPLPSGRARCPDRERRRQNRNRVALRIALPAVALGVFVALGALYWFNSPIAFDALRWWGVPPPVKEPFLDLRYIFAGVECWEKGVNVYLFNPCDPLGRPHGYSPLWLRFAFLPSQSWTPVAGIVIDLLFALSLAAFPPPQSRGELAVSLAAVFAPPIAFAVQRANVDVIIFLMLVAAARLWARRSPQRILGYGIVTFAGLLKFYPLIVLSLALRERFKICAGICSAVGVILLGFAVHFHVEFAAMARNIPTGSYFIGDMFGAKNLADGVLTGRFGTGAAWLEIVVWIVLLGFAATIAVATLSLLARHRDMAQLAPIESALLLFGAAVIAGCFFAGQSVGYRGIFLVFTVPGLLALRRQAAEPGVRRLATQATALVLFVLWQGVLTWNGAFLGVLQQWAGVTVGSRVWLIFWAARELAWWVLAGILSGLVLCFVVESPAVAWMRHASANDA